MGAYVGDFLKGQTVRHLWSSYSTGGASITRATNGTVSVYEDGGTAQFTSGVTDTEDFDAVTGVHMVTIDTTQADYEPGKDYHVVLSGATIDGQSVNAHLFSFSIENRATTKDRIKARGDARSGSTAGTMVLAAGAVSADDEFNLCLVWNRTKDEWRIVVDTINSSDTITVYPDWRVLPAAGDDYLIFNGPPYAVADLPTVDANGFVSVGSFNVTPLTANAGANLAKFAESHGDPLDVGIGDLNSVITNAESRIEDLQGRVPSTLISGRMSATVDAINDNSTAAAALAAAADSMVLSTTKAGTLTTTQITTNLTESNDNHYVGRTLIFTSGTLAKQQGVIAAYVGGSKLITLESALTSPPAAGDSFVIV